MMSRERSAQGMEAMLQLISAMEASGDECVCVLFTWECLSDSVLCHRRVASACVRARARARLHTMLECRKQHKKGSV